MPSNRVPSNTRGAPVGTAVAVHAGLSSPSSRSRRDSTSPCTRACDIQVLVCSVIAEVVSVKSHLKRQSIVRCHKVHESETPRHTAFVCRQVQHVEAMSFDWPFKQKLLVVIPRRNISNHDGDCPRCHVTQPPPCMWSVGLFWCTNTSRPLCIVSCVVTAQVETALLITPLKPI